MEVNKSTDLNERMIDLMIEQDEIIEHVSSIREKLRGLGLTWNRFRGNAIFGVIAHYLQRHLPDDVKLVKLAWIEGCATEFDILIVDKNAKPFDFTDAYPKEQVKLLIEIKGSGVFYKREEVKKRLSEMFEKWKNETGKPALYLSIWEAKAHAKEVQDALGNDTAFILQIENEEITWGEWERFLNKVNALIRPVANNSCMTTRSNQPDIFVLY